MQTTDRTFMGRQNLLYEGRRGVTNLLLFEDCNVSKSVHAKWLKTISTQCVDCWIWMDHSWIKGRGWIIDKQRRTDSEVIKHLMKSNEPLKSPSRELNISHLGKRKIGKSWTQTCQLVGDMFVPDKITGCFLGFFWGADGLQQKKRVGLHVPDGADAVPGRKNAHCVTKDDIYWGEFRTWGRKMVIDFHSIKNM